MPSVPIVVDLDDAKSAALTMTKSLLQAAEALREGAQISHAALVLGVAEVVGDLLAETPLEHQRALTYAVVREIVRDRKRRS